MPDICVCAIQPSTKLSAFRNFTKSDVYISNMSLLDKIRYTVQTEVTNMLKDAFLLRKLHCFVCKSFDMMMERQVGCLSYLM